MITTKRLIVVAGGTGGHIFPGIAVAHHLIADGWQVRWIGTSDRIESYIVPQHGIDIDFICSFRLRGKGLKKLLLAPVFIFNAWRKARSIIKSFKPAVVLCMGGYVSGPCGLAAWSLGIPVVLHEQNCIAGLTNKLLAFIAIKVLQAFTGAFKQADVVGNPLRLEVLALQLPQKRFIGRKGPIRVLVIGGSQGAHILNKIMPQVAAKLSDYLTIWHQSGKGAKNIVEQAYEQLASKQHKVTEFIEDIAAAYAWADIVVCRSGALTVSEIAVAGLPAIFVPFKHKDRQQYWNALTLEKVGAAKIFEQHKFTVDAVAKILASLNREALLKMAVRARTTAITDATERVANEVILAAKAN